MNGIAAGLLLNAEHLEFGRDYRDDKEFSLIIIGATEEDDTTTPVKMDDPLVGCSLATYTVPTGKKVIPLGLWINKRSFTTDDLVQIEVCETATAKIEATMIVGQTQRVETYPFSDHEFVAGKVINLYLTSGAAAVALFADAKFIGIEVDA